MTFKFNIKLGRKLGRIFKFSLALTSPTAGLYVSSTWMFNISVLICYK